MKGTVKITAVLQNPAGVWEREQQVEFPEGLERDIIMRVLTGVRAVGMITEISPDEVQIIPEHRVVQYNAKLSTITLASNFDMAKAIMQPPAPPADRIFKKGGA